MTVDRNIATPPRRGIGFACMCRSKAGATTHPRATATSRTTRVRMNDNSKAVRNDIRNSEVIPGPLVQPFEGEPLTGSLFTPQVGQSCLGIANIVLLIFLH